MRRITAVVEVLRRVEDGLDRYGNATETWDPVPWGVWGIAPRESDEPDTVGRDVSIEKRTLYGPLPCPVGPRDRVILPDGLTYEVEGEVGDWTGNPHGRSQEGAVVRLERSEG